eukprot:TRINITY_DN13386_c0_g1_i1.p1 TRINITY_DN13386_c0_g1~~TRINITY_DN13386_c0_g1_i1.p1  ORF type:complete len:366 (+),score=53.99 TRINITY_DN13386_c0_g1_i1:70-1098(+)
MAVSVIPASEVPKLLPMNECIERVEASLMALKGDEGDMPLRFCYKMPLKEERVGIVASMPAYMEINGKAYCSNKVITVYPANKSKGLESHQGTILLFEADHGKLVSIVDASTVTAIRTAAASAVATKLLAVPEASHLAILGCGTLAHTHLESMLIARPTIREVSLWSRSSSSVDLFVKTVAPQYPNIKFNKHDTPQQAVLAADIICTLTPSTEPYLDRSMVKEGCHINAVGACTPIHCEIAADLVKASKVFADATESCVKEPGDIVRPLKSGEITVDHVQGELADILLQNHPGRSSPNEITLFESLGLAIEDLACSHSVYENYLSKGSCKDVVQVNLNPERH